jgi:hypothetical protein
MNLAAPDMVVEPIAMCTLRQSNSNALFRAMLRSGTPRPWWTETMGNRGEVLARKRDSIDYAKGPSALAEIETAVTQVHARLPDGTLAAEIHISARKVDTDQREPWSTSSI